MDGFEKDDGDNEPQSTVWPDERPPPAIAALCRWRLRKMNLAQNAPKESGNGSAQFPFGSRQRLREAGPIGRRTELRRPGEPWMEFDDAASKASESGIRLQGLGSRGEQLSALGTGQWTPGAIAGHSAAGGQHVGSRGQASQQTLFCGARWQASRGAAYGYDAHREVGVVDQERRQNRWCRRRLASIPEVYPGRAVLGACRSLGDRNRPTVPKASTHPWPWFSFVVETTSGGGIIMPSPARPLRSPVFRERGGCGGGSLLLSGRSVNDAGDFLARATVSQRRPSSSTAVRPRGTLSTPAARAYSRPPNNVFQDCASRRRPAVFAVGRACSKPAGRRPLSLTTDMRKRCTEERRANPVSAPLASLIYAPSSKTQNEMKHGRPRLRTSAGPTTGQSPTGPLLLLQPPPR
ncbi:hypothetical protein BCR34DRAFT_641671 [Clohesyomyces aquaticus]|uniref:Uncharacterized protein n=1 Tax=Clohesyomyces aquaticus TaxID=1231657 RepID=A0A1Y1ZZQ0_9PLEO|nr:hypothetical protein BCR34DRAFT_641671 [Clohesyomyces aquaticus]